MTDPLQNADSVSLPPGMTAVKLRLIADWLDTYDKLGLSLLGLLRSQHDAEELRLAVESIKGKEAQLDLRAWAAHIDGSGALSETEEADAWTRKMHGR